MNKYSFEGRVAVVTGAGRGIGRAHAHLLAERGATVIINDLGGTTEGYGADDQPARTVAAEIIAAGGTAIPNAADVSKVDGSQALIHTAIKEFGRIDILVNNAGNIRWGGPREVDADNIYSHFAVHVLGSFNTTRAAWPHMVEQQYGRVVMTTSTGIFGLPDNLGYATAKAALIGMARSLTVAAAGCDIKINLIAPNAWTRMGAHPSDQLQAIRRPAPKHMEPELVSPMVAYLAHEACDVSGEIYTAGAGRFARIFLASTEGYIHTQAEQVTIEDVADNLAAINNETGYYVPADLMEWAAHYMAHREGATAD
jgi:NAD(P)-dependent dehydrogenase (short-subunit alcohol dehydrogenase family)